MELELSRMRVKAQDYLHGIKTPRHCCGVSQKADRLIISS